MSGLTTIKLSSEDLKKEQERQRKRGRLIFKTFKKGKVKVVVGRYDEDGTVPDIIFQYHIHNAHFRSIVDYTNGEVICVMDCYYDDIDIFNEDGSEITEKLPLWLVSEIENKIEDKFGSFNVELRYMQQSDGKGKKSLVNESEEEDQKLINKTRVIYKGLKKGGKIGFSPVDSPYHEVHWTLPNKFYVKIKHHDKKDAERYQLKVDSYPILLLNTETINYTKTNDKPLRNGEKHLVAGEITDQFKKHGITVYWGGQVPKYSIFSPNSVSPDETYTEVDTTPKSK
jgi:hypothetical protein